MRLYHPTTLKTLAERADISKRYSCSIWSEIFKWKASGQKHPKMFIDDDYDLGMYLRYVYKFATEKGCNLNIDLAENKLSSDIAKGFGIVGDYFDKESENVLIGEIVHKYFDNNYLFSDACSLHYKGVNIFPDIYGDEWRKYILVLKVIKR